MPIFQNITDAELAAWRDPGAIVSDAEPSDPAEHFCMYHDQPGTVPITAEITSRWGMIRWACRPCADAIVAYLHGADLKNVDRQVVITAAKLSAGMAKTLQGLDEAYADIQAESHTDPETG